MHAATAAALRAADLDPGAVAAVIRGGLAEDLGTAGDLTTAATVPAGSRLSAAIVSRADGVVAGVPVALAALDIAGARLIPLVGDGDRVRAGQPVATVEGEAWRVLAAERLTLNLLGRLSGIASLTRVWVDALAGTATRVRDTRKTTPGLRQLEKYAVRCGGGVNHRRGLDDAILIKDNHLAAAGGVTAALDALAEVVGARSLMTVQVEVDNLDQLEEVLAHPLYAAVPAASDRQILCDNFTVGQLAEAVRRVRAGTPHVCVEASGGITLEVARDVAATGVDFIAVGALTHSAPALDLGMDSLG